jgi:hypothetical protein
MAEPKTDRTPSTWQSRQGKFIRYYLAFIFGFFLLAAPASAKILNVPNELKVCLQNADCHVVTTDCGGFQCTHTHQDAVNKSKIDDFANLYEKECEGYSFERWPPNVPYLQTHTCLSQPNGLPSCVNGLCQSIR